MNVDADYFRKNKWLYHFTSFNIAKTIIRDKKLKYSMLRRTNDVCEYAKTIYNEYFPDSRILCLKILKGRYIFIGR